MSAYVGVQMSEDYGLSSYIRLVNLIQSESASFWDQEELGEVWAHQLDSVLVKSIEELGVVHALRCETLGGPCILPIRTLKDLIHHPRPAVELFMQVGRWMEQMLGNVDELLPRDIALCLFNLAVVLARVRC